MEKITILHSLADQEKKQVSELVIIPDIERTKMVESCRWKWEKVKKTQWYEISLTWGEDISQVP